MQFHALLKLAAAIILVSLLGANAFNSQLAGREVRDKTSLNAVPPMIISPIIKKFKEEQAKKNQPMAGEEELKEEARGLRVGANTWKFPPIWPYAQDVFKTEEEIVQPDRTEQLTNMMGMMSGVTQIPTPDEIELTNKTSSFNAAAFWGEEVVEEQTELDAEAKERLTEHYGFYLKPGMSILEFGAAEDSYLPEDVEFSRHVGVGLNPKAMEKNPSLTDRLVVDLNKVVPDGDVDSDELRSLISEPFDAIIMANTIDYLTHPREVYKSAWYLLKPGGLMIVPFSSQKATYANKFSRAQTKMWTEYNDDQHMWVAGSFFYFSAGDGWEQILGFDISPESAKKALENNGPLDMFKQGKDNNMYVVQASKGFQSESIDENNLEESIKSRMWMLPTLESRDKQLVVPRLAQIYKKAKSEDQKSALADNLSSLSVVYESLIKMDQFAFSFQMQSQLAADLVGDPSFTANEEQIKALKQGLGLRSPSENFWEPVGMNTADMVIEDKVNLLAHLVPRFGSGNPEQETALDAFASGLKPTFAVIRAKCPDLPESDVQLLGTELLCAEILIPGRSTKEQFAAWLGVISESELKDILETRKSLNAQSQAELKAFREARAAEEARLEDLRKKYQEQVEKAREVRTMAFNPRSGKFEEIKKK